MNFWVGQKVVRIGWHIAGSPQLRGAKFSRPEIGEVCTIKTINVWPQHTLVTLVEHDNSHLTTNGWEPGFDARGFRPVVKRKTDISIFKRMLTDARASADAHH